MNTRRWAVGLIAVLALWVALTWLLTAPSADPPLDRPSLNDVAMRLTQDWDRLGQPDYDLPDPPGGPAYSVVDAQGQLLTRSSPETADNLGQAWARHDTVIDLERDGRVIGRVLFATARDDSVRTARLRWLSLGLAGAVGLTGSIWLVWLDRRVLRPFRTMEGFARQVAAGDLDAPLRMDRVNAFGAFTEAFDLMRHELAAARQRERRAELSKQELIASLSHDIKTPLASIKALSELMAARARLGARTADPVGPGPAGDQSSAGANAGTAVEASIGAGAGVNSGAHPVDPDDRKTLLRLESISAKADQIDALVSELFDASLEDLSALGLNLVPIGSDQFAQAIRAADPRGWSGTVSLPDCLVLADPLRLSQVVGNVVANAYKYAAAPLLVSGRIAADQLWIDLVDAGPGLPEDELPLVTRRFHRGRAAAGRPGAGLGLYLAQRLTEAMGGQLICANRSDGDGSVTGFAVTISLPLA
ncbi:MAG: HAMP domain-containing histidine kinase [Propionibacteriaceae bacterium]|jgi:signal transduction histidine kinase|nr:HAMP domain-containing histidine kinase [Propionibacteriaceae bacterium]